ncbi:hypothetical protein J2778_002118 [Paraburkholderia graminis]|nr:hypothetical protein [Paraburkholderia graminis]
MVFDESRQGLMRRSSSAKAKEGARSFENLIRAVARQRKVADPIPEKVYV